MSKESQVKKLIREIVGAESNFIRGTVTKITGQTCSVKLSSGLEVSDVKLKSLVTDENDYFILFPVVGSGVLMLMENQTLRNLTVIKVDKVAKFEFSQSDLKVVFDSEDKKVSIKNNNSSLLELFEDLATIIKQLKVFTPVGPSGTPLPDTISAVVQLEQKVNQLLK